MLSSAKEKKRKGRESISLGHSPFLSSSPSHVANSSWHIQLEHAIHNAGPEDLRSIIAQLKITTGNAQMKLLSVSTQVREAEEKSGDVLEEWFVRIPESYVEGEG